MYSIQGSTSSVVNFPTSKRTRTDFLKPEANVAEKELKTTKKLRPNKRLQYCRFCDRGFKTREFLVRHFTIDHPMIKKHEDMFKDPYHCEHCDNWFDGPRRLSYHVKSVHKDTLPVGPQLVECKLCGAILKSSLIKHTLTVHANEIDGHGSNVVKDPRRCSVCNKMFSGEQGIRRHMFGTHGIMVTRDYKCDSDVVNPDLMPVSSSGSIKHTLGGILDESQIK